jgi:hypothetical protein
VKVIEKEQGQTRVHARALELLGTMSDAAVCGQLAEEGWLVNPASVRAWRTKAGIPAHQKKVGAEYIAICVRAYKRAGSIKGAARLVKIDVKTMRRHLATAGVAVGAEHDAG